MFNLLFILIISFIAIKQNCLYIKNFLTGGILFKVNQTAYQLPENIFEVNELTHWLDFYEDASKRTASIMNAVSTAYLKRD